MSSRWPGFRSDRPGASCRQHPAPLCCLPADDRHDLAERLCRRAVRSAPAPCRVGGLDSDLTGLVLHAANTLLLFVVFRRMTGTTWQSGFVAALFALHPLHVESVAWIPI